MSEVEFYSEGGETQDQQVRYQQHPEDLVHEPPNKRKQYFIIGFVIITLAVSIAIVLKYSIFKNDPNFTHLYKNVNQTPFIPKKSTE